MIMDSDKIRNGRKTSQERR